MGLLFKSKGHETLAVVLDVEALNWKLVVVEQSANLGWGCSSWARECVVLQQSSLLLVVTAYQVVMQVKHIQFSQPAGARMEAEFAVMRVTTKQPLDLTSWQWNSGLNEEMVGSWWISPFIFWCRWKTGSWVDGINQWFSVWKWEVILTKIFPDLGFNPQWVFDVLID